MTAIGSAVLIVTMAWAALGKITRPALWSLSVMRHRVPSHVARATTILVPGAEAAAALALAFGYWGVGAAICAGLMIVFSIALVRLRALLDRDRLPCGCFGSDESLDYRVALARNAVLLAVAIYVFVSSDRALAGDYDLPPGLLFVVAAVAFAGWILVSALGAMRGPQR